MVSDWMRSQMDTMMWEDKKIMDCSRDELIDIISWFAADAIRKDEHREQERRMTKLFRTA